MNNSQMYDLARLVLFNLLSIEKLNEANDDDAPNVYLSFKMLREVFVHHYDLSTKEVQGMFAMFVNGELIKTELAVNDEEVVHIIHLSDLGREIITEEAGESAIEQLDDFIKMFRGAAKIFADMKAMREEDVDDEPGFKPKSGPSWLDEIFGFKPSTN